MPRRTSITDAAISTLATAGIRGLTHRAVDRAAGLPEGSTSYYFRTRLALLRATVQRLAEIDTADLPSLPAHDLDTFAAGIAALVHRRMTTDRHLQLARYELTLEATRRPELRETLVQGGASVRAIVADLISAAGVPAPADRAHDLVALIDGLLLDQVVGVGNRSLTVEELQVIIRKLTTAISS